MGANTNTNDKTNTSPKSRREKPQPLIPNGHTPRFLYLILKQTNLKQIDWQEVADGSGISRGQAAKSRYSRFRKQIESMILGDQIQVKREGEERERGEKEGEKGGKGIEGVGSCLKRGFGEDENENEEGEHVKKRIKLEGGVVVKREYKRRSSIVSINDDDDDEEDDESTINSSITRPQFIKSETGLNNFTPYLPIKRELCNDGSTFRRGSELLQSFNNPVIKTEGNMAKSPVTPTRSSGIATPARRRSGNYRSPWAVFESEDQEVSSTSVSSGQGGRKDSGRNGKGSALEPFSID